MSNPQPWLKTSRGPILQMSVPASQALAALDRLRQEGSIAVIVGSPNDAADVESKFKDSGADGYDLDQVLAAAEGMDGASILDNWVAQANLPFMANAVDTRNTKQHGLFVLSDSKTIHIAILPTRNSYEAPAFLRFGNWNACPTDEEHIAILREWHRRYGAEVVVMTYDTIELQLPRPITDPKEAWRVAIEMCAYTHECDIEAPEDFGAEVGSILNQRHWFCWWD